ncbi:TonB-dependent receptor [Desulfosarcina ovata]|uniref:Ligand-gated channel protein n=1 Tax=Desulfosarcina ovata subsp. ovata TaxID=2752305 RepID=A0A5K8AKJ4_9BACT|nr:TonB-dependent receptor [Desulfosarcina ovata]BBO93118.1 ligand-gated channel protein [Desulfosarcina ovata subsp. ovata]
MSIFCRFTITFCFILSFAINGLAEDNVYLMDTIVVTATRSEDNTFDVPTPISTIDEQRLQETAPASIADAIADIPGVSMESAGSWETSPVIRGLGQNRVLVLYDGDRETNLWAGRMPFTPFMDMGSVSRIEVVKGPASALYGTDALGGVINIITREVEFSEGDQWQMENTIKGRYSSTDNGWFGRYELAAGGKGLGFLLGISGRDVENYTDGNGDEINNSQFENRNLDLKARYALSDKQGLTASLRINQIDDMGVPQKDPSAPYSHFDRFDTNSYKLGYEATDLSFFENLKARIYYVDQDRSFKGRFPSSSSPVYNLKSNDIETSAIGGSFQGLIPLGDRHGLTAGFEAVREGTDSTETQLIQRNSNDSLARRLKFQPVPDAERYHYGAFVQDEMHLMPKLTLIAGGRYDYFDASAKDIEFTDSRYNASGAQTSSSSEINDFSDADDSAATFNIGLLYRLTEHYHLTANVGSGFRAPDIFERFSTRGGGSQILIGDPDLDPEYSYNYDVGMKVRYSRFQGSFNLFYTRVDDYIDTVLQDTSFISDIPTYKYVNVQDAELYGFDGEAQFAFTDSFSVFGTISSVVGKDRDSGDRLNNIPPLNGTLGVRWESHLYDTMRYWIELSGDLYARQNHPAPDEDKTPGYAVFNLRTGLDIPTVWSAIHDMQLTLNIENILDKYYLSHLRKDDMDFIPEPGINIIAAVQFGF